MAKLPLSRRSFIVGASAAGTAWAALSSAQLATAAPASAEIADTPLANTTVASSATTGEVAVHWLDGVPTTTTGAAFGLPWPRGQLTTKTTLAATTAGGDGVPLQTWPLAYWPDGSVKWTGHALGANSGLAEKFLIAKGTPTAPEHPVVVKQSSGKITVSTGDLTMVVPTAGTTLIESIARGDRITGQDAVLMLTVQDGPDDADDVPHRTPCTGVVYAVSVERHGAVRAVLKITGSYRADTTDSHDGKGKRSLLPFTVRLYISAGAESIRLVHSFIWDADPATTFVRGLGLRLRVPMTDEAHNRHVRFVGNDGGVWGEPVRVLTGLRRDPGSEVKAAQVAGTATPAVSTWATTVSSGYTELAVWNDYTLFQGSPTRFDVWKRTSSAGSWLTHAGYGEHAAGLGYLGGVSGGLGFGLNEFWQRFPRSLDIRDAGKDTATVTLWSWSPHAPAMDMRHYDTVAHGLNLSYEDVQERFSTPLGIARSTEIQLWAFAATPSRTRLVDLATTVTSPPQPVASPAWYHGAEVFGRWSLPDRSTTARAALEDGLLFDIGFYLDQVKQRQWYGFWNYGDVMHTYDNDRHTWRYDVGGYAWDNGELGSDLWLWYAFLRSGTAEIFHLASRMTQHISETDFHHTGKFAGLGSRHNVSHWGDGAKEARIAESATRRFRYYLTTDELTGDWMTTSLRADTTLLTVGPLREVLAAQTVAPTRLRIGPDWYALVSNWLTAWERTGDTSWRDRIITGMKDIATFPAGLFTGEAGGAVGFDPTTAHLTNFNTGDYTGGYNLSMAFGGDQILWEAVSLVDVPAFNQVLLDFAHYAQATSAEKIAKYGADFNPSLFATIYSRVTAWAGEQLGDATLRSRGWSKYQGDSDGKFWTTTTKVTGPEVLTEVEEIASAATNSAAQRGLAVIALLEIAPDEAP